MPQGLPTPAGIHSGPLPNYYLLSDAEYGILLLLIAMLARARTSKYETKLLLSLLMMHPPLG